MLLGDAIGVRAVGDPREGARGRWAGAWQRGVRPGQGTRIVARQPAEQPTAEAGSRIR